MTVQSASSLSSWTALAAIFSATMIFNVRAPSPRYRRWLRRLRVNLLRCPQAGAQFHLVPDLRQHLLQRPDGGNRIQVVVVAEMRNAEELTLHLALAVRNHRAKAITECPHDIA